MSETLQITRESSLWECLHDGIVESISSDSMARTLSITVDSPFHREFHELPTDTRLRVIGQNVRIAEAFDLEPWVGAIEPAPDLPWREAQEVRLKNYEKGLLISTDWKGFAGEVATKEEHQILEAKLTTGKSLAVLELGVMSYPNSNYRTVMIHAASFRFQVGEREISIEEFQEFGAAYWDDWSEKSKAQSAQTDANS
jgi:hypothetical protein